MAAAVDLLALRLAAVVVAVERPRVGQVAAAPGLPAAAVPGLPVQRAVGPVVLPMLPVVLGLRLPAWPGLAAARHRVKRQVAVPVVLLMPSRECSRTMQILREPAQWAEWAG